MTTDGMTYFNVELNHFQHNDKYTVTVWQHKHLPDDGRVRSKRSKVEVKVKGKVVPALD
jgi:hypothetical protein